MQNMHIPHVFGYFSVHVQCVLRFAKCYCSQGHLCIAFRAIHEYNIGVLLPAVHLNFNWFVVVILKMKESKLKEIEIWHDT